MGRGSEQEGVADLTAFLTESSRRCRIGVNSSKGKTEVRLRIGFCPLVFSSSATAVQVVKGVPTEGLGCCLLAGRNNRGQVFSHASVVFSIQWSM